jgi:hypothetical protein
MASIADLRRPEYTGRNRCWPCTVLNTVVLLGCCLVLAVLSFPLSLGLLLAGAGAIWLRGYLVPRTPALTARIRGALERGPDRPLTGSIAPDDTDDDLGERTLTTLLEAGVIRPEGERLHLDERFADDWRGEMERLRTLPNGRLIEATAAATRETEVELLDADRPLVVLTGPDGGEAWVSRPVTIAEVAAEGTLATHVPTMSHRDRIAVARALRSFLDRCPICETRTEEVKPNRCCGGVRDPADLSGTVLVCPTCNEALYRFDDG